LRLDLRHVRYGDVLLYENRDYQTRAQDVRWLERRLRQYIVVVSGSGHRKRPSPSSPAPKRGIHVVKRPPAA
jgi:hypothetical protein